MLTLPELMTALGGGEEASTLELAVAFPFLPLALFTAAVMLAFSRTMHSVHPSAGALVRDYVGDAREARIPAAGASIMVVLCGWAVALYAGLIYFHIVLVGALSSVTGVPATIGTAGVIDEWAEARREDGLTGAELAAYLNEYGSWSPDSPEAGIPELFPELSENMPAGDDTGAAACTITITAAVTDPAAVRDVDWLTSDELESDLKYCIRTTCPSPVAWDAPDSVVLVSSHTSRNKHWLNYAFIDVFAEGRAVAPGGYCAADGRLAERYQG